MKNIKNIERYVAILLCFVFMLSNQLLSAQSMPEPTINIPLLVLDEDFNLTMPKRFRITDLPPKTTGNQPSLAGLDKLKAAASAQFSRQTLMEAIKKFDGPVWIIDLRKESHGFINGTPISWYSPYNQSNIGESDDNIQRQEQLLFNDIKHQGNIIINKITEKTEGVIKSTHQVMLKISDVKTEYLLVEQLRLGYLRLGVQDHHRPEDSTVDTFIDFAKNLPEQSWLYFHCRGGKGRSTTFMVMYDILRNAHFVSLDDIVERQALLGGSHLFNVSEDADDAWKREAAVERKNFIIKFYQYVKDPKGLPKMTWSEWVKKHK